MLFRSNRSVVLQQNRSVLLQHNRSVLLQHNRSVLLQHNRSVLFQHNRSVPAGPKTSNMVRNGSRIDRLARNKDQMNRIACPDPSGPLLRPNIVKNPTFYGKRPPADLGGLPHSYRRRPGPTYPLKNKRGDTPYNLTLLMIPDTLCVVKISISPGGSQSNQVFCGLVRPWVSPEVCSGEGQETCK